MKEGFEKEFTDVLSEFISLCLEYAADETEKVFAYIYRTEKVRMFNAFFRRDGKILSAGQLGTDEESDAFMQKGRNMISRIIEVCEEYEQACPNELKLTYDVPAKNFDVKAGYEDYTVKEKVTPFEVFLEWFRGEKKKQS